MLPLARLVEMTAACQCEPYLFFTGGVLPSVQKITPLLDILCGSHGVGPVCHELNIAPSIYYRYQNYHQQPETRSQRDRRDDHLKLEMEIQRVYDENYRVYDIRKVWRQLQRAGSSVARCTIARLMKNMGLTGVLRGKKLRTTVSRREAVAGERVNRQFVAERPNQLWVADFTFVRTWQGFAYEAFIIDVFAGAIVGWRVSSSMETTFVRDALEPALWARRLSGTLHHSVKGSQYTQRLQEVELLASTGTLYTILCKCLFLRSDRPDDHRTR
ncbi:IS3 family transposase [Edwardsiella ictaluri]|uniref:IS3 family transposase n=1 Tax=Edwardsiella ictaluri TaxID=67780 RepID=UPI003081399A